MAKQIRRKKSEMSLEPLTCTESTFVDILVNSSLSPKALVLKILKKHGPFTAKQLVEECRKEGKVTITFNQVTNAIRQLSNLALIVKANGGWAIYNWYEVGVDSAPETSDNSVTNEAVEPREDLVQ